MCVLEGGSGLPAPCLLFPPRRTSASHGGAGGILGGTVLGERHCPAGIRDCLALTPAC